MIVLSFVSWAVLIYVVIPMAREAQEDQFQDCSHYTKERIDFYKEYLSKHPLTKC